VAASLFLYFLELWSGESLRHRVRRIDKRFNTLVFKRDLDRAGKLFERHDRETILIGRFVPGTGAPLSVLAGIIAHADLAVHGLHRFRQRLVERSVIGLGWELGAQWPLVKQYASIIEYMVLAAVPAGGIFWILWRRWKVHN
jgi:membrane protein DedA with SNARE-associated domain